MRQVISELKLVQSGHSRFRCICCPGDGRTAIVRRRCGHRLSRSEDLLPAFKMRIGIEEARLAAASQCLSGLALIGRMKIKGPPNETPICVAR